MKELFTDFDKLDAFLESMNWKFSHWWRCAHPSIGFYTYGNNDTITVSFPVNEDSWKVEPYLRCTDWGSDFPVSLYEMDIESYTKKDFKKFINEFIKQYIETKL